MSDITPSIWEIERRRKSSAMAWDFHGVLRHWIPDAVTEHVRWLNERAVRHEYRAVEYRRVDP